MNSNDLMSVEINDFHRVWDDLACLAGKNCKLGHLDKIARILSLEYVDQNKDKRAFTLASKFEPSVSFSKKKAHFLRIAWTCIDQEREWAFKKIFGLYKDVFSPEKLDFILKNFFSLTPYLGFGLDGDAPRLKIYAYLRNYKRASVTNGDVAAALLRLCDSLDIPMDKDHILPFYEKKTFFVTLCVDLYPRGKCSVKVYHQVPPKRLQKELEGLWPRFDYAKEKLLPMATGNSLCLTFGRGPRERFKKSVYLRFYRSPLDFDFRRIEGVLGSNGDASLETFIRVNKVASMPLVSFLGFGEDKFTVYLHPGF